MTIKLSVKVCGRQTGHNGSVPTVRPDLPPLVDEAIDTLGNRVRVAVIRSLLQEGSATRTELSRRLGLSLSLLQNHLRKLEELAVVYTDPPRSEPGRLHRRYVLDIDRLDQLRRALTAAISPDDAD